MNSAATGLCGTTSWLGLSFDRDPAPRLVLGVGPELLEANHRARELLEGVHCGDWRVADGRLDLADPDARRLDTLIARAIEGPPQSAVIGSMLVRAYGLSAHGVAGAILRDLNQPARFPDVGLDAAFGLTRAEHEVLLLVIRGLSAAEIAAALSNSVLTVRTHLKRLHAKLGVARREQLFARVIPFLIMD
jgi:DNA-binding CsgD family transcriptional regulator